MKLQITFKNFENTPSLQTQIERKSLKLKKLFNNTNLKINWYCWTQKDQHYTELQVSGHAGPIIMATAKADNLYKTFDDVIKKVSVQARKKNELKTRKSFNKENLLSA